MKALARKLGYSVLSLRYDFDAATWAKAHNATSSLFQQYALVPFVVVASICGPSERPEFQWQSSPGRP